MVIPIIKCNIGDVKIVCEQRMNNLFPKGIPEEIQERYKKEIQYLEQSEYFDEFEKRRGVQKWLIRLRKNTKQICAMVLF